LKLIFIIVSRAVSLLGLSRREWWWKDAEILMLRHQLAVAERERPRAHSRLKRRCPADPPKTRTERADQRIQPGCLTPQQNRRPAGKS
jgi:hypothetical protein